MSASITKVTTTSFPHYSGHVLGGYCASPYAARGEDAYVLAWDGAMFPCLYAVEAKRRKVERLGIVFYLLGDAYHSISQQFHPFDAPLEWPKVLTLPGKIMAYIARGRVQERAVARFQTSYQAICATGGVHGLNDETYTEPLGKRILEALGQAIVKDGESDADMLASWHQFLEGLLVQSLQHKVAECHLDLRRNLILVGGCALNIKWNRALRRAGLFESIWVPPFPNDSGSAIGAACCALTARQGLAPLSWSVYSGPEIQIGSVPADWQARPCTIGQLAALLHETGEPVVFLNGRAELGPRALGNRSILASPRDPGMKGRLNWIKGREDYRPIAPVCLEDRAADVFAPGDADPYMLFDHEVRPAWREQVPAICHEDGTARVQTVNQADHPKLFALLVEFERLSGVPVLCNTSANWPGRGFFPDVQSATEWGRVPYVWCNELLYQREQQDLGALR